MITFILAYNIKYQIRSILSFPMPMLPRPSLWGDLFEDAFIIAIIAFSVNASMAFLFARKHNYTVDSTQVIVFDFYINFILKWSKI